jgi:succinate dehydrogenase / fumarate reductase cytochrome b subunit
MPRPSWRAFERLSIEGACATMRITSPVSVPDLDLDDRARAARRLRRVFSASGVFPLGVFLVVHLVLNAQALRGASAFVTGVRTIDECPLLPLVESVFVFAPLVFHGALGVWLVVSRTALAPPAPYRPAIRIAMRATGLAVVAFLAMHLSELRFHSPGVRLRGDELATLLDADLSSTWRGVPFRGLTYLVGTACVTFHFACGLWGAFATTRAGRRSPSQRAWAAWGAIAAGAAMWAAFADVVVLHATGAKLFDGQDPEPAPSEPCPGAGP